jgi:hypothetical protein
MRARDKRGVALGIDARARFFFFVFFFSAGKGGSGRAGGEGPSQEGASSSPPPLPYSHTHEKNERERERETDYDEATPPDAHTRHGPRKDQPPPPTPLAQEERMAAATAATTTTTPSYASNLRAPLSQGTRSADQGPACGGKGRAAEWRMVLAGDPVEINPSVGEGRRVVSVGEWAARWRRNGDTTTEAAAAEAAAAAAGGGAVPVGVALGRCLACGSDDTKEHGEFCCFVLFVRLSFVSPSALGR